MRPNRVMIADEQVLFRDALALAIDRAPDFEVVGTFGTARAAADAASRLRPRLILLDAEPSGANAFESARQLRERLPALRVVFVSSEALDRSIEQALAVKAAGFLAKDESLKRVLAALREICSDDAGKELVCSPAVRARLRPGLGNVPEPPGAPLRLPAARLSGREREVLAHLARGLSRHAIADTLCISRRTVDRHVENLMRKTRLNDRLALARFAYREGFARP